MPHTSFNMETAEEAVVDPDTAIPQETPSLNLDSTADNGVETPAGNGEPTGDLNTDVTADVLSGLEAEEQEKQVTDTTLAGEDIEGQITGDCHIL